jgi:cobalt-zinc-cadmium efflux system outer membrane protein
MIPKHLVRPWALLALVAIGTPGSVHAQAGRVFAAHQSAAALDSLALLALATSPLVRAADARVEAARHRIAPAGARPDPVLMGGIVNQPLGAERQALSAHGAPVAGGPDPMTMRMLGVEQTIPYPGKLGVRRQAAELEVDAANAAVDITRRQVVRDIKSAYYDLAFLDQASAIAQRNEQLLGTFIEITETRYAVGTAGQHDVLNARVEATRLAETAASLLEERRAALARLNAILNRASETAVEQPLIPPDIVRAAVGDSARPVRFSSAALGARVADSPLPSLIELEALAVRQSPELREHEAMIAAQRARVDLARKSILPDVSVSLQYGWRPGLTDMITAVVSLPVPLQRRSKQDELVADADAELAALEAEHHVKINALHAEVARLVSELERERTQLALATKATLPLGRAALASATSSYQVGKVEFLTVLDGQATLFTYETDYFRALSDFAKNLAELERVVGKEILR